MLDSCKGTYPERLLFLVLSVHLASRCLLLLLASRLPRAIAHNIISLLLGNIARLLLLVVLLKTTDIDGLPDSLLNSALNTGPLVTCITLATIGQGETTLD